MSDYASAKEKQKKDKLLQTPIREEKIEKSKKATEKNKITVRLKNHYSSFSAGIEKEWDGYRRTALIGSHRNFDHKAVLNNEKYFNRKRKTALFPGALNAHTNNVNKEKSAVFLKEIKERNVSSLIWQYRELLEKSSNSVLHKAIPFLSKKPEIDELNTIMESDTKNQRRIDYLRNVMNLKEQRALEFKNKLINAGNENQNAVKHKDSRGREKDSTDSWFFRAIMSQTDIAVKDVDGNEETDPDKK